MLIPERVYQRTITWVDRDETTGCLVSRYSVASHGYAQIGWQENGKRCLTLCHRVVWIHDVGPIADGYTVDHQCPHGRNRKCIELTHLRTLTNFDNARRTFGRDWPLGQCINGHPDSELRLMDGGRRMRCHLCAAQYQRTSRARKLARV